MFAFFVLICVLVGVHEYGHFWAARRCGVRVLRFSIGFGKVLFKRVDKKGTEWVFSLIPLGGYVKMLNDEQDPKFKEDERYDNKNILQRAFILFAGPLANFIFAIFAYWVVFMAGVETVKPVVGEVIPNTIVAQANIPEEFEITEVDGENVANWEETVLALVGKVGEKEVELSGHLIDSQYTKHFKLDLSNWNVEGNKKNPLTDLGIRPKSAKVESVIQAVSENSAAQQAGLKENDQIITINGQPFDWKYLIDTVQTGKTLQLQILRNNEHFNVDLTPQKLEKEDRYIIGITPKIEPLAEKYRIELKYDILTAFAKSIEKVYSLISTVIQFLGNLITGDLSLSNMGGPIAMAKGAVASAEIGAVYYLSFMALISVNLGVMNLFPILPLDGGQLVLLAVEAIRGKRVSETVQLKFQQLGMIFVLGLSVFALYNDLIHF